jgi:hypothetical protein
MIATPVNEMSTANAMMDKTMTTPRRRTAT